jgi:hypothetical protein
MDMRRIILFSLLLFSALVSAQDKVDTLVLSQIREEGMNHSHAMELISWLCDVHGQRLNWSPEFHRAADWAAEKLNAFGLQNVHFERWAPVGKGWTLKKFSLQAVSPLSYPLEAYPKAWSPGTRGAVSGHVIYLTSKNDSELVTYKNKLKGAFVLLQPASVLHPHFKPDATRDSDSTLLSLANSGATPIRRRGAPADSGEMQKYLRDAQFSTKKMSFCIEEGAAAILEPSQTDDGTLRAMGATVPFVPKPGEAFGTRPNAYDANAPKILPQIVLTPEQYNRFIRVLQKGTEIELEMNLEVAVTDADSGKNIIGEIPGSDLKDQVVLIGGHFDSWHSGTGATDNGTGTVVAMEAMRILKALNLHPRRTIKIGLWGGEEQGLLGSRAYVKQHLGESDPVSGETKKLPEFEKFSVYFNDDNGAGRFRGIYLQGNEVSRPIFRSWFSAFGDAGAQTLSLQSTGSTDHQSFDRVGVPAFQFIQDPLDYFQRTWHTNMDVVDRVQEDDLKQAATLMAFFAYQAAMRDDMFPRKPSSK